MGTAAVISPIEEVQHGDDFRVFYSETEVGLLHVNSDNWQGVNLVMEAPEDGLSKWTK